MLQLAIEKGVIVSVAFLVIALFGIMAIFRVPVQMTPDIDSTIISVITYWPGATPQDIEKEILIEQEEYLRKLPRLHKMTAEAKTGTASIELEFQLGTDIQEALIRVNNALSQVADYPENVDQPTLRTSSASQDPFIFYSLRIANPALLPLPLLEMKDELEKSVVTRLERIAGVSEATLYGGVSRQIQVELDAAALSQRGISISQLRQAIRSRNRDMSGGDIDSGKQRFLVRTLGRYESLQDIANTIIADRNGIQTKLGDVAHIKLHHEEIRGRGYINGEPTFMVIIRRDAGANVIDVLHGVKAEVEILNNEDLADVGLKMEWVADDVGYVKSAIHVVQKNLIIGGVLACLILWLFLRAPFPTLLGTLGVPISTIGALLGLLLTDRTLNVISLAGIAFAIGMTLDNSIVVLENIFRHRSLGKSHFQAALDGVQEVWRAVLASTLTTVFVFIPILLIEDEAGQLYSDIAIAIAAAIIMSMLVAVSLIPAASARLSDDSDPEHHPLSGLLKPLQIMGQLFQQTLLRLVASLIEKRLRSLVLVSTFLTMAVAALIFLTPQAEYLPEGEEPKLFALMIPPPGYNLEEMDSIARQIQADLTPYIHADIHTDPVAFVEGRSDIPAIKYVISLTAANRLFNVIEPVNGDTRHVEALQKALAVKFRQYPGMIGFVNRGSIFSGNSGGSRGIELEIQGPELAPIYQTALNAYLTSKEVFDGGQIRPIPGLTLSQPTIEIRPDWQRAAQLGINSSDLGYLVWALGDGVYLDEFFLADDKIDLYLYGQRESINNPQDIGQLPIYSNSGQIVPLSAIANISETVNADTIRRVDGERTVTLLIVPPRHIPLEAAVELVRDKVIGELTLQQQIPTGVNIRIAGAVDKLHATRQALSDNLLIAIALSYLLMVAIFSHWGYPLLILLTIPLGISGGITGLWLMNQLGMNMPFDIITMLGMVVLIGVVVNNPILLVEKTRCLLREGSDYRNAIQESTRTRLRPIMMSMLTTVFGLAPVVFMPGEGTELYRGLGAIVLFGLLFATLITLIFLPALLSLVLYGNQRK